ncbi:MAG: putative photosynthetic complex assembly protein PuhE [Hyphomicrobium sp.]
MTLYGWPMLYCLMVWWFSTGAVLYVIGLPRRMLTASVTAASAIAVLALIAVVDGLGDGSLTGAYIAFTAAIALWGWHEVTFLTGLITGPRTTPLPEGLKGASRLGPAVETVIYHELALFVTLVALAALSWQATNTIAAWTFFILWVMRLSAKLNVFLGVPNLTEHFLPDHLQYLTSYFSRRPMNLLFPVSVMVPTVVTALLVQASIGAHATDFEATGLTFLATLLGLAVIEHWFLVLPMPSAALWTWGLASREPEPAPPAAHAPIGHTPRV